MGTVEIQKEKPAKQSNPPLHKKNGTSLHSSRNPVPKNSQPIHDIKHVFSVSPCIFHAQPWNGTGVKQA